MKKFILCIGFLMVMPTTTFSAELSCLNENEIRKTDRRYEESLIKGDIVFLNDLLAEEFIWVHNNASMVESKDALLERYRTLRSGQAIKSRDSTNVEVRRKGNVAVITGFTTVVFADEFVKQTGESKTIKFHFMRTYVAIDGKCILLANHTMQIPDSQ